MRKLFLRLFKRYRRLELKRVNYLEAEAMLTLSADKPEPLRWCIAPEEDHNRMIGTVYLERRERILL